MRLAQDNHMIDPLSPDRADQPFSKTIVKSSQLHPYRLIGGKPSWLRMSFTPCGQKIGTVDESVGRRASASLPGA